MYFAIDGLRLRCLVLLQIILMVLSLEEFIADKAVSCSSRSMDVRILFTRPFNGGIFTEQGFSNSRCRWSGNGLSDITLNIGINDTECGVVPREDEGEFTVKLIVSPVEGLIVDGYSAINVRCVYSTQEITLTLPAGEDGKNALKISGATAEGAVVTGSGGTPMLIMQILDGHGIDGQVVSRASVGQRITLDILLKDTAIYDFYVHSCFAHDGSNTPDASVQIIDVNGCGVRLSRAVDVPVLVSEPSNGGPKHVYLHMYGFQFTSSQLVHFECQVRPCVHSCKRQQCESPATKIPLIPARRRRSDDNSVAEDEDEKEEKMNSLRLTTVLRIEPQTARKAALIWDQASSTSLKEPSVCVSLSTLSITSLLVSLCTAVISISIYILCRSFKKTRKLEDEFQDNYSDCVSSSASTM